MQQSHRTALVLAVLGVACGTEEPKPTDLAPVAAEESSLSFEEANERFDAMRPALEAIQARFEPEFFALPGAVSIGIGLEDDGETPVFRSVVSDALLTERLPRAIEGVRLDHGLGQRPAARRRPDLLRRRGSAVPRRPDRLP